MTVLHDNISPRPKILLVYLSGRTQEGRGIAFWWNIFVYVLTRVQKLFAIRISFDVNWRWTPLREVCMAIPLVEVMFRRLAMLEYVLVPLFVVSICYRQVHNEPDNSGKWLFVSVMNMLLIYLFASMKLENGHKKDYLALVLKLCYTMLFYEMGWNIRNGGLNKKSKYYSLEENVFSRLILFRDNIYNVNWTSAQSFFI